MVMRAKAVGQASGRNLATNRYGSSSTTNEEHLNVGIGYVDLDDGGGPHKSNPAGPIALSAAGLVMAVGGVAGILNLLPCPAWMATLGGSAFIGLSAAAIVSVFGKPWMELSVPDGPEAAAAEKLFNNIENNSMRLK